MLHAMLYAWLAAAHTVLTSFVEATPGGCGILQLSIRLGLTPAHTISAVALQARLVGAKSTCMFKVNPPHTVT